MNARALRDAIVGVVGSDARGKMKKKGKKVKGESRKKTKKKKTKKRGKAAALEALKSKLGKVVSQKQYEESLRADALGVGAGVIDVEASVDDARQPAALATLGACPLVSPVVVGDTTCEVPIAMVEICTGKDCRKRGSESIVNALKAELPRGWACSASGKCISNCKRGVNARLVTAIGKEKFSRLDVASARALFVPMALATNELNASFDEMELDVAPPRGRRSSVVDDAKEISRKVRESDVPPGFLPRVQM